MVLKAQKASRAAPVARVGRTKRSGISALSAYQNFNQAIVKANPSERISIIRSGVDARMLVGGSEFFEIPNQNFFRIIGVASATAARKIKNKIALGPYEAERLARVALIEAEAESVFGSEALAKQWLLTENHALGSAPLQLLDTEIGANEIKKVLAAIAYGGAV